MAAENGVRALEMRPGSSTLATFDEQVRSHTASRGSRLLLALQASAPFDIAAWPLYLQQRKVGVLRPWATTGLTVGRQHMFIREPSSVVLRWRRSACMMSNPDEALIIDSRPMLANSEGR